MQQLEVFQSLWAMELRRPDGVERAIEESFAMVADAGYAGMAIDLGVMDNDQALATQPYFDKHGLACLINAFPQTIDDLRPVLEMSKRFDTRFVNIIGQVMPIRVDDMIPVIRAWIDMAGEEEVPILFETHRNCITNDLFSTLQLIDAIPEMALCADLSHYLVDREFWFPISDEDDVLIQRILARSEALQGRVASREQIQVQISFPQHRKWFDQFAKWWADGIGSWRGRSASDATLNFLCELGPPEYAITGPDGYELSDRWEEALLIKDRIETLWAASENP